ncbi:MAG: FIST N-terminal domain-containing protein [Maritimibacter sp.]
MDQSQGLGSSKALDEPVVRTTSVPYDDATPMQTIAQRLRPESLEILILFVTPQADFDALIEQANVYCKGTQVIGCTTAGEISKQGYTEGEIVAIGFPREYFRARTTLIEGLAEFDAQKVIDNMIRVRNELISEMPDWSNEFNFLLVDGLSTKEDKLVSDIALGFGPVPLFGGSAGDGEDFSQTFLLHKGKAYRDAAVLTQIRTRCPIRVFKSDHVIPTDKRMVVTGANPDKRTVHEINAEPAAREYARILGKDPEQLTSFTFAAHPVVVRIGGHHHVRSIQRVEDNGELVFFSAIDEGLVLTLAEPQHIANHLRDELASLSTPTRPDAIIACDCVFRRMEAQEKQLTNEVSSILSDNNVVGFSTYGEQHNSMHINQTLTGVAIYPPES